MSDTVRIERHRAWHEPTQAQKRAGNYAKRKILWRGLQLAIENEAGSVRTFLNPDGSVGEKRLIYPYGYVCCSTGADGDEVDVFVGQDLDAPLVFIIRAQAKGRWDQYDEDKVMIGFSSLEDAEQAFLRNYDDPRFLGEIVPMLVDEFVSKVRATAKAAPAMLKSVVVRARGGVPCFGRILSQRS
ncbi:MAG: hypothetical protein ACJ75S_07150 [Solirubrobacterales bacterium]